MDNPSFFGELVSLFYNDVYISFLNIVWTTKWFWLPPILFLSFIKLWYKWRQMQFIIGQDYTLLEVRLPTELTRSPKAMESVFHGIHVTSNESTWYDKYLLGKSRRWYSLELVSIEGNVHFYIRTRTDVRNLLESQIYAQYPDVEIVEVEEDYARLIDHVPPHTNVWGCNFFQTKGTDAYPIKTYIDYGLEREGIDEEEKVDPLASTIEFMSALGPGEQVWIQILCQATKDKDRVKPGTWFQKEGWRDEAARLVKKLRDDTVITDPETGRAGFPNPTKGEADVIAAIERSTNKVAFECGIRGIYWAKSEKFKGGNISGLINSMKHYNSLNLNGFAPKYVTDFDYPWEDFRRMREHWRCKTLMDAYRKRSWFHPPYQEKRYVLNTEELATIYHFPGSIVHAPGLKRIESKRSSAPTNLPT